MPLYREFSSSDLRHDGKCYESATEGISYSNCFAISSQAQQAYSFTYVLSSWHQALAYQGL